MLQNMLKDRKIKFNGLVLHRKRCRRLDNIIHYSVHLVHFMYLFLHTVLNFFTSVTTKRTKLNRGQVLATAVEATGMNKLDVAARAGYSRSSYYKHIENPQLEYHILMAYGKAIKYDFTEEFPDMPKYVLEDPEEQYTKTPSLDEAIRQRDQWKDKYLELLEKYNRLIEQRMENNK